MLRHTRPSPIPPARAFARLLLPALLLAGCASQPSVQPVVIPPSQPTATGPAVEAEHPLTQPNVALDPAAVASPLGRTTPATVDLTLTVKEVTAEIAGGVSYDFWTFDGTVPGPLLRVMQGDTVNLTLVNPATNKMAHNIDLHAVTGPGGGAAVTNVAPGESKTLTFKALQAGAYIYHCAFPPPMHHIAQGMYGVIVVEPPGGLPPVDREFYVVQGDWYTSAPLGTAGHMLFDNTKAMAEQPEYITFNGHAHALTDLFPLHANVGESVRIFFGDGGPNVAANFHIIGEIFDKVYTGSPDTFIANEETVVIPPGSAAIFELKLEEPGQYLLVDHALFRVNRGAAGVLIVDGPADPSIYSPQP
jgi:nitrite reductase (NO-forming)